MDDKLEVVLESTKCIGQEILDGRLFTAEEKQDILSQLQNEGIVFKNTLGREWVFSKIDSANRKGILISFAPISDKYFNHEIRAEIAEELNLILKREIQEHKNTQNALKHSTAKLQSIFDSTALFIWTLSEERKLTGFNDRFQSQMRQWYDEEMIQGQVFIEEPIKENIKTTERFISFMKKAFEGKQQQFETALYTLDGTQVWIEVFMEPVKSDSADIKEICCIAFETTEKKRIEKEVGDSLKEKETLLQEVHHRVKNNLQIISSILNLQASYVKDEHMLALLRESKNRIYSMAYIHESLYRSKNFGSIEMSSYIRGLCSQLVYSYCLSSEKISLVIEMEEIELTIDQAIPCGLIVNEIVSNSLKYAFPDDEQGTVTIKVKETKGSILLCLTDSGIGIEGEVDIENTETLGMQLISSLTDQLDGEIEFSAQKGTEYLITFEKRKAQKSWPVPTYS